MRLLPALIALLLALLLAPAGLAGAQAGRSYAYERIDVDMELRPDGDLLVAERYTYRFSGGPFRKALRGIPLDRVDSVRDISLAEGDAPYKPATSADQPGTFVVDRFADEVVVTWFYPEAADETRTFTLRYTVSGAVRSDPEADEVWWVALFPDRDVPVARGSVTMRLPAGAALRPQDVILPAATAEVEVEPEAIRLRRDLPLLPGEALELRVVLDPDLIAAPKPGWQVAAESPVATAAPASGSRSDPASVTAMLRCLLVVVMVVAAIGSIAWRAINGDPIFTSEGGGGSWGGSGGGSRSSSSGSRASWSGSRPSSSGSRSSSSRSGGSTRGGSGGGRGGAG